MAARAYFDRLSTNGTLLLLLLLNMAVVPPCRPALRLVGRDGVADPGGAVGPVSRVWVWRRPVCCLFGEETQSLSRIIPDGLSPLRGFNSGFCGNRCISLWEGSAEGERRGAGRGFPPRIGVRGRLCAGMTGGRVTLKRRGGRFAGVVRVTWVPAPVCTGAGSARE